LPDFAFLGKLCLAWRRTSSARIASESTVEDHSDPTLRLTGAQRRGRAGIEDLSYETTEDSLREAFSEGGASVSDLHILIDRETGRSRGFGFVEMSTDEEAQAAIESWDGRELDNRSLKVNEARERR